MTMGLKIFKPLPNLLLLFLPSLSWQIRQRLFCYTQHIPPTWWWITQQLSKPSFISVPQNSISYFPRKGKSNTAFVLRSIQCFKNKKTGRQPSALTMHLLNIPFFHRIFHTKQKTTFYSSTQITRDALFFGGWRWQHALLQFSYGHEIHTGEFFWFYWVGKSSSYSAPKINLFFNTIRVAGFLLYSNKMSMPAETKFFPQFFVHLRQFLENLRKRLYTLSPHK